MSSNGISSSNKVFVLYKVSNSKCDSGHGHYNAFTISRPASSGGVTLAEIKRQCTALKLLPDAGPDGFHWRVRVDDNNRQLQKQQKQVPFTWWDVIDENSRLPVKENVPLSELEQMFAPHHHHTNSSNQGHELSPTVGGGGSASVRGSGGAVAGAVRKAFLNVASTVEEVVNISSSATTSTDIDFNEPRVSVISFKLLDLIKLQNECNYSTIATTSHSAAQRTNKSDRAPPSQPSNAAPLPTAQRRPVATADVRASATVANTTPPAPVRRQQQPHSQPVPSISGGAAATAAATAGRPLQRGGGVAVPRSAPASGIKPIQSRSVSPSPARVASATTTNSVPAVDRSSSEELLMDFGATTTTSFQRSFSAAVTMTSTTAANGIFLHETKEETLKREYAQKAKQQNRVWDEVDERWVVVETKSEKDASVAQSTTSTTTAKIKGISLDDTSNAAGKSAHVQSAVHRRVSDMKMAQEKAKDELKQRKEMATSLEEEEDVVRIKLDPKIKKWSEEHGKKKQLSALLSSLHLVIWPESQWKQVNLGDLLEEKKLRSCYKRASLKVHPDKTKDLNAGQRFLAKRIFDALTQAMTVYEDAKRS